MKNDFELPRTIENSDGVVSTKKRTSSLDILGAVLIISIGASLLVASTYIFCSSGFKFQKTGFYIMTYIAAATCIYVGWVYIFMEMFRFGFSVHGIKIKYPMKKEQLIDWDEFHEICICYGSITTRGQRQGLTVICLVKKGEKKNFLYRWNVSHYKKVITIYYSEEILTELKKFCPYDVVDLRKTTPYRL